MQAISPNELDQLLKEGKAIPFDIRDSKEFDERHIPGAVMVSESGIDENLCMTTQGKEAIFYCTSGMRTELVASRIDETGIEAAKYLDGGLNAWSNHGLPTVGDSKSKSQLSIQRQVQITIGIVLLLLAFATWSGTAWASYAVAAVGLGLGVAGITGTCAMARVLTVMPWNRG